MKGVLPLLRPLATTPVYLARGATDMRKSIDSLATIVTYSFELDPFQPALFVFCSRGRDKIKILYSENNGFWLLYRRLEKGRFVWPGQSSTGPGGAMAIELRQLQWLLDGLDINQVKAHAPLSFRIAA